MPSSRRTQITVTTVTILTALCAVLVLAPELALAAASDDWVKPATGMIETLQGGVTMIAQGLLLVAIVVRGIMMAMSGTAEWQKMGMLLIGALLVAVGPKILIALLEASKT